MPDLWSSLWNCKPTFFPTASEFFVEELIETQGFFPLSIVVFEGIVTQSNSIKVKHGICPAPMAPSISKALKKGQLFPNLQSFFDLKHWLNTYYMQGIITTDRWWT